MSIKKLVVLTEVQKVLLEKFLLNEIRDGYWKNSRPQGHQDTWKDVDIELGIELGPKNFSLKRNYNFTNVDFYNKMAPAMLEVGKTVDPNLTMKFLKRQLVSLNHIMGGRLKELNGEISKRACIRRTKINKSETIVRKVLATFVD